MKQTGQTRLTESLLVNFFFFFFLRLKNYDNKPTNYSFVRLFQISFIHSNNKNLLLVFLFKNGQMARKTRIKNLNKQSCVCVCVYFIVFFLLFFFTNINIRLKKTTSKHTEGILLVNKHEAI